MLLLVFKDDIVVGYSQPGNPNSVFRIPLSILSFSQAKLPLTGR